MIRRAVLAAAQNVMVLIMAPVWGSWLKLTTGGTVSGIAGPQVRRHTGPLVHSVGATVHLASTVTLTPNEAVAVAAAPGWALPTTAAAARAAVVHLPIFNGTPCVLGLLAARLPGRRRPDQRGLTPRLTAAP